MNIKIISYCKKIQIDWFASCWDISSVKFMNSLNIPCFKIASASVTDLNLIKEIKTCKPIIISTGMSTMKQINAIQIFKSEKFSNTTL